MSENLLLVTLGPVQEFIAQARRTRDLWFGSHLLSELSRAAARALVEIDAELVFPPLGKGDPELMPSGEEDSEARPRLGPRILRRKSGRAPMAIANKLLAIVPDRRDPEAFAREARSGAEKAWRAFGEVVRDRCRGLLAPEVDAVWKEQIDTLLEFNATWSPLDSARGNYDEVRRCLEEVISGRKHLRDFPAWKQQRGSVPKSSLDGGRETVLAPPDRRAAHLVRRYRIASGEQLDAVGLIKRAGGEPEQFVPIANIALAAWIEGARRRAPRELDRLATECAAAGIGRIEREDLRWTRPFPFDALVFLEDRWSAILDEAKHESPGGSRQWGKEYVLPILERMSAPYPYVACLVADGDSMGRTLGAIKKQDRHRVFARELSRFAEKARTIIEQEHRGVLVYAGGDDVLAFVCLDDAFACAEALRRAFEEVMTQALSAVEDPPQASTPIPRPTLSVGLGVGHLLESMGELLALGRRAEQRAKNARAGEGEDRNALAIIVDKRSGGEVSWRGRWDAAEGSPVARLWADVALLGTRLSTKKVYEIQADVARMPAPEILIGAEDRSWADLLSLDTTRTLDRATEGEGIRPEEAGLDLGVRGGYAALRRRIERWISRTLVARTFDKGRVSAQAGKDA